MSYRSEHEQPNSNSDKLSSKESLDYLKAEYNELINQLVLAINTKSQEEADNLIAQIQAFLAIEAPLNEKNEANFPSYDEIDNFFGNILDEDDWSEIPILKKRLEKIIIIKPDEFSEGIKDRHEIVADELSELQDPIPKIEEKEIKLEKSAYDTWKDEFVLNGRAIRLAIRSNPPEEQEEFNKWFLDLKVDIQKLEDDLAHQKWVFSDEINLSLFEKEIADLEKILSRVAKEREVVQAKNEMKYSFETDEWKKEDLKNHPSEFLQLKKTVEEGTQFLKDDLNNDPREKPTVDGGTENLITILSEQIKNAEIIKDAIRSEILGLRGIRVSESIDNLYINSAKKTLELFNIRAETLDEKKFDNWKLSLKDALKFPNLALLEAELNRPLPVQPYGIDTPENRLNVLFGNGGGLNLIEEAQLEIDSVTYFLGEYGEKQSEYLKIEYLDKKDALLKELWRLEKEQKVFEQQGRQIEISLKAFKETIDKILAIPKSMETAFDSDPDSKPRPDEDFYLNLDTDLVVQYESLLAGDAFNIDSQEVDSLIGKDNRPGQYSLAKDKITKITNPIKERRDHPLFWEWSRMIKVIQAGNIDVYDHVNMAKPDALQKNVDIYNAFHARKGGPSKPNKSDPDYARKIKEYVVEDQKNIDAVSWIVLSKIESINQNENQIPTCTRSDLFPMINSRHMQRDTILKATTYHPVHGELMREMLDKLMLAIADGSVPEISYEELTSSGSGRRRIRNYLTENFKPQAEVLFKKSYPGLSQLEIDEKVDHFFALSNVVYNLFDLLTVSFAELQTRTKTGAHQKNKGGRYFEQKNYVAISRPDAALVHNTQRYNSPSHVSAWFLMFLKTLKKKPEGAAWAALTDDQKAEFEYGREGTNSKNVEYYELLREQQAEIITFQNAYYDVSSFTGDNGLERTTIFDPLFPDSRSFLHLSSDWNKTSEMLEFGDEVWGLDSNGKFVKLGMIGDSYVNKSGKTKKLGSNFAAAELYEGVAEKGWEKILSLTFGDLPNKITRHMILESSNTGGDSPNLGLIDVMINNGCGMAKMFPGRHMKAVEHLFSHYLFRIFSRYRAGHDYRVGTFQKVVEKIQGAAGEKGGLGGYQDIAANIIRNISSDNIRSLSDSEILSRSPSKFEMSDSLLTSPGIRRRQRIEWLLEHYEDEGYKIPRPLNWVGERLTGLGQFFDQYSNIDQAEFWKMVEGEKALPAVSINRDQSLFKVVDSDQK